LKRRQLPGPSDGRRRTLRLWHLALAVLMASLVFGAIRVFTRGPDGPVTGALAALVLASVAAGISFALIKAGRALAGWATAGLRDRGVHIGGVIGFGIWLAGLLLEVGYILVSIAVGPIATIALILWLSWLARQ
jgi:hypothetical protein